MSLKFSVLTLFPEMFEIIKNEGVIARAIKKKIISIDTVFLRDFANDKRKNVDDHPVGGGDGMVLKPDIAQNALNSVLKPDSFIVNLCPQGQVFNHKLSKELSQKNHIILLCGRYSGFDSRFTQKYAHIHISIGDYVLSGGELPAMCLIDSVSRYLPGVLGNDSSAVEESFEQGLLEEPQYTKPLDFEGIQVPEILLSGNHKKIAEFKRQEKLKITALKRPDLILEIWDTLSQKDKNFVKKFLK